MKSFTDIEQSKKLASILPLESADMFLALNGTHPVMSKYIDDGFVTADNTAIPCWSLAALLDILRNRAPSIEEDANVTLFSYRTVEWWDLTICNSVIEPVTKSDPIDACVEMIIKLKEKNLL